MSDLEREVEKLIKNQILITDSEAKDLAYLICELPEIKGGRLEAEVILQGVLLPCPFCGGKASMGNTILSNENDNKYYIYCTICGTINNFFEPGYNTKEITTQHWNKRAGCEPQSK